jgi:hypothetical protein
MDMYEPCPAGQTCLVSSEPEVIFSTTSIVERETEIKDETVSYEMWLSAPPGEGETVNVTVKLTRYPSAACVQPQEWRVNLDPCNNSDADPDLCESTRGAGIIVSFDRSNYNGKQEVRVRVGRNDAFEGVWEGYFEHEVSSSLAWYDVNAKYSQVYPTEIELTINDDDPCGAVGASKSEYYVEDFNNTDGYEYEIRRCECEDGYYVAAKDSAFCDSVTACTQCAAGMVCDDWNADLQTITLEKGYFRATADSSDVVECPTLTACAAGATHGNSICAVGHEGPLCNVCQQGYVSTGDSVCVECEDGELAVTYGLFTCITLAVGGIAYYILRKNEKVASTLSEQRLWSRFCDGIQTKYKIMTRFFQTMGKLTALYPYSLSPVFLVHFDRMDLYKYMDINILPIDCVVQTSFHDRLLITTVIPFVFVLCIAAVYVVQRVRLSTTQDESDRVRSIGELQAKSCYVLLLFMLTVFPLVSGVIFQTFQYDERLDGFAYLVADYSIEKDDPKHAQYTVYAVVMCCLYCIGIPVASLWAMYSHLDDIQALQSAHFHIIDCEKQKNALIESTVMRRDEIFRAGSKHFNNDAMSPLEELQDTLEGLYKEVEFLKEQQPLLAGLSPLYQDYKPEFWYFEVLQFITTLFLVGIVTTLRTDAASQVFFAVFVSSAMLLLFANLKPYLNFYEGALAQAVQAIISFTLLVGLLTLVGVDASGIETADSTTNDAYGILLLVCLTVVLAIGLGLLLYEFEYVLYLIFPAKHKRFKAWRTRCYQAWTRQYHACFGAPSEDRASIEMGSMGSTVPPRMNSSSVSRTGSSKSRPASSSRRIDWGESGSLGTSAYTVNPTLGRQPSSQVTTNTIV